MAGWISLDRCITKHWLWQGEKFSKGQAWVDLLLCASHSSHKVLIKGVLINVSRGEQIRSQVTLAKAWNWDRKTVSRFLKLLEKDGMIATRSDHLTSYVSICNYDSFQDNKKEDTQLKGQQEGQQSPSREDTINNGNNGNTGNNLDLSVKPEAKPSKYKFDSYQMEFAVWMHNQLLIQNPNFKKPNLESWANTLRLMLEVDKRDPIKVGEVFQWANQDDFWSSNILSPVSLRKQFDKLIVKLNQPQRSSKVINDDSDNWERFDKETF